MIEKPRQKKSLQDIEVFKVSLQMEDFLGKLESSLLQEEKDRQSLEEKITSTYLQKDVLVKRLEETLKQLQRQLEDDRKTTMKEIKALTITSNRFRLQIESLTYGIDKLKTRNESPTRMTLREDTSSGSVQDVVEIKDWMKNAGQRLYEDKKLLRDNRSLGQLFMEKDMQLKELKDEEALLEKKLQSLKQSLEKSSISSDITIREVKTLRQSKQSLMNHFRELKTSLAFEEKQQQFMADKTRKNNFITDIIGLFDAKDGHDETAFT